MPQLTELPEDHMLQAYGIFLLEKKHRLVRKLERQYTPSIHGHRAWLSSFLLMDYLLHQRLLKKRQQVLELGCGWGPASIFCARHGGCKVTGVDLDDEVFPFLEVQASLNSVEVETKKRSFERLGRNDMEGFHLVFGTDVCFWDELVPVHFKLIKRALDAGVKHIIYTDPGRTSFLELGEKCKKRFGIEPVEWYSTEPEHFEGFVLHIRNPDA